MKIRKNLPLSIVCIASFFSLITASVAWFQSKTDVNFGGGHGSTAASYFESGAGTEANPYIVSNQTHLYNLAWLQYLGQFNTEISPTHFKLKNDIDMSGWGSALPPIGTQDNPFIGIFDGDNHTIKNITISNDISDMSKKPTSVQSVVGCDVIGFFGIVGDPLPIGIVRGDSDLDYDQLQVYEKLNLEHFNLENVVIKSIADRTLMGVVAGYVNGAEGTVNNIAVLNGSLQAKNGVLPINHFASENIISKFSLIGETEDTVWQEAYEDGGSGGDGPGEDTSFGGSMDMWSTNRRVTYIMKEDYDSVASTATYFRTKNSGTDTYGAYMQIQSGSTSPFCVTSTGPIKSDFSIATNASYATLRSGSLPLNVDTSAMFEGAESISTLDVKGTILPVATTGYYSSHRKEIVLDSNTGYFTGDKPYGTNSTSGKVVFGSKKTTLINNSLVNSQIRLKSNKASQTGFTYITDESQTSSITSFSPENYGFTNYSKVRESLIPILQNASSSGFINGFRLSSETGVSTAETFKLQNAKICGNTYPQYCVLPRGLNFTVSNPGRITLVITGYDNTVSTAKSMFRLYSVQRSQNKESISSVTEITKVYLNDAGSVSFNSNSVGGTLLYDSSHWNNCLEAGCLYYCEIPVNPGDYFIGGPQTGYSGYLVYLDIGGNGKGSGGGDVPTGNYDLKNVRYVHSLTEDTASGSSYNRYLV